MGGWWREWEKEGRVRSEENNAHGTDHSTEAKSLPCLTENLITPKMYLKYESLSCVRFM